MCLGGTKGLGKAIVEAFLAEGVNVSYCSRSVSGDEFESFIAEAAAGCRAVGSIVDIADAAAVKKWVDSAMKEFGRLDAVIANGSPRLGLYVSRLKSLIMLSL